MPAAAPKPIPRVPLMDLLSVLWLLDEVAYLGRDRGSGWRNVQVHKHRPVHAGYVHADFIAVREIINTPLPLSVLFGLAYSGPYLLLKDW